VSAECKGQERSKRRPHRILHQLHLVPGEHHEAVHPWRVSQLRTSQQQLIGSGRDLLRRSQVVDQLKGTLEGVKGVVGVGASNLISVSTRVEKSLYYT
jgi:hypothetical protein